MSGSAARAGETDCRRRQHRAPARPNHFNLRLEDGRLCCLVIVGVRADGTKELVAVADGEREAGAWPCAWSAPPSPTGTAVSRI